MLWILYISKIYNKPIKSCGGGEAAVWGQQESQLLIISQDTTGRVRGDTPSFLIFLWPRERTYSSAHCTWRPLIYSWCLNQVVPPSAMSTYRCDLPTPSQGPWEPVWKDQWSGHVRLWKVHVRPFQVTSLPSTLSLSSQPNSLKHVSRPLQGQGGPLVPRTASLGLGVEAGPSALNTIRERGRWCRKHQAGVTRPVPSALLSWVTFSKSQTLSKLPFTQSFTYFYI